MKRLLFFILHSSFFISCAMAQPMMRDVFAAMPDSVLPLVTKNNRLDCIDFMHQPLDGDGDEAAAHHCHTCYIPG